MWQLWAWSLAVPAALALAAYGFLRWVDSPRYSRGEVRNMAVGVFAFFALATAAHNWLDDGERPDPYHDAQTPGEMG